MLALEDKYVEVEDIQNKGSMTVNSAFLRDNHGTIIIGY